jgi:hypothetical protein
MRTIPVLLGPIHQWQYSIDRYIILSKLRLQCCQWVLRSLTAVFATVSLLAPVLELYHSQGPLSAGTPMRVVSNIEGYSMCTFYQWYPQGLHIMVWLDLQCLDLAFDQSPLWFCCVECIQRMCYGKAFQKSGHTGGSMISGAHLLVLASGWCMWCAVLPFAIKCISCHHCVQDFPLGHGAICRFHVQINCKIIN